MSHYLGYTKLATEGRPMRNVTFILSAAAIAVVLALILFVIAYLPLVVVLTH